MLEILGHRSVLPHFTGWIRASEGPCAQMCLVQLSIRSSLTRSGHLCGGEGLKQGSLALVKVVMEPALPSSLSRPSPLPPTLLTLPIHLEKTQLVRKHLLKPNLPYPPLPRNAHSTERLYPKTQLAAFSSRCFPLLICWTNIY